MAGITSSAAERIADKILSTSEEILAVSIYEERGGNVLASKRKEPFTKAFGVFREGPRYGGSLAVAFLSIANEVREIAGEPQTIVTTYEKCKMMLIRLRSYEILVGLALLRWVDTDDDAKFTNNIERAIADVNDKAH